MDDYLYDLFLLILISSLSIAIAISLVEIEALKKRNIIRGCSSRYYYKIYLIGENLVKVLPF